MAEQAKHADKQTSITHARRIIHAGRDRTHSYSVVDFKHVCSETRHQEPDQENKHIPTCLGDISQGKYVAT